MKLIVALLLTWILYSQKNLAPEIKTETHKMYQEPSTNILHCQVNVTNQVLDEFMAQQKDLEALKDPLVQDILDRRAKKISSLARQGLACK